MRFNAPPGWPPPPSENWLPPPGWRPDPSWPKAPRRWAWWTVTDADAQRPSPLTGRAKLLLWAAAGTAVASAGLLLTTTTSVPPTALGSAWVPLFLANFVIFGAALIRLVTSAMPGLPRPDGRLRAADWQIVRRRAPASLLVVAVGAFVCGWLIGASSMNDLPGQPEQVNGDYFANDHGSLIPLTRAEYERAVTAQTRVFTSGVMAFATVAVVMTLAAPLPPGRVRR